MELNWSTLVLEMINFLVLVWILKHFLYKPVLDMIARRRAGIEKALADAEGLHMDAEKLQEKYQGRLAKWDQERQRAREALAQELETERAHKLAELQISLQEKQNMAKVAEAHRQTDARKKCEAMALEQGARFAARLLKQASGPETEARLVEWAITELTQLSEEHKTALLNSYGKIPVAVIVTSAFPLSDSQRERLEMVLAKLFSPDLPLQYEQNSDLLAGLRITVGAWVLDANIRDELKGFVTLTHAQ